VYRNNVIASLIEALKEGFPAVCRLVGEDCFRAVARMYAAQQPPDSPVMLGYGATFADFLAGLEPLASLPYLPDVARIEHAWLEAYHAAEAIALAPAMLAGVPEALAGAIRFAFHPSLRIVRSSYPALTIWRMNVSDGVPQPIDLRSGAEDALIVRPEAEVEVRAMPSGAADLLQALAGGQSLGRAAEAVLKARADFDLADHLAALLEGGLIVDYSIAPSET
jgi:hypothetical protein